MRNDSVQSTDLPQAAVEAVWKGNTIEAIKIVRLERDIELKEAKDQVDAYVRNQPALQHKLQAAQAQATQTLVRWVVGVLMLAAVAAYVFVSGM
jgi:ribosomal protein L7/L12